MRYILFASFLLFAACTSVFDAGSVGGDVQSGSYAKMITVGDYIYAVDRMALHTLDVSDSENPKKIGSTDVGRFIESIYHINGYLFIGSGEALYIYEIATDGIPFERSATAYEVFGQDQTLCDPVVADDKYAYVTLSTVPNPNEEFNCQRWIELNELRVYDIRNIDRPNLVHTVDMAGPKGLGIDDQYLFVCDSDEGLKVYDRTNSRDLELIHHFDDIYALDVIAKDGLLVVVGPDNIYQYDYSDIGDMHLLSVIKI